MSVEYDICEKFISLSGESRWQGLVCNFIRFAGCSLDCSWCDTVYSKGRIESKRETLEELLDYVEAKAVRRIILTGGEPLEQENLEALCEQLMEREYLLQIETSGAYSVDRIPAAVKKVLDVKPKSARAGKEFELNNLDIIDSKDELKFLVSCRKDYEDAKEFVKMYDLIGKIELTMSPVEKLVKPDELAEWLINDNQPFRLRLQLHKILWPGEQRER